MLFSSSCDLKALTNIQVLRLSKFRKLSVNYVFNKSTTQNYYMAFPPNLSKYN